METESNGPSRKPQEGGELSTISGPAWDKEVRHRPTSDGRHLHLQVSHRRGLRSDDDISLPTAMGVELGDLKGHFQPKPFCDSMISRYLLVGFGASCLFPSYSSSPRASIEY